MSSKIELVIEAKDAFSNIFASLSNALGINIMQFTTLEGAAGAVVGVMKQAVELAADEETSLVQLDATIQSMGLSSKMSADSVRSLAEALMQTTNFEHEDLEAASQVFMRMESFDPSNLERMLKVTADYAAGTGQDAASAAQAIATALETGNTRALRFSLSQRTMIQDMIKNNDAAGALTATMDILNGKFGGQAAAQMDTYAGKMKTLKQNWEEFLAGGAGGGLEASKGALDNAIKLVTTLSQLENIGQQIKANGGGMKWWDYIIPPIGGLEATIRNIIAYKKILGENADYAEANTLSLSEMGRAANYAGQNVLGLTEVTEANTAALDQMNEKYLNNILSFARMYRNNTENITEADANLKDAEEELHALQAQGWGNSSSKIIEAKDKVEEMRGKLGEAKQAAIDATNEMIAGFLQASLAADGTFDQADIQKVLDFRREVGLLNDEEFGAAILALQKVDALVRGIPSQVNTTVTVDYVQSGGLSQTGSAAGNWVPNAGGNGYHWVPAYATGASHVSGLFMTGESGRGGEYVYAPGGATVFNAKQTKAMQEVMGAGKQEQLNYIYGPVTLMIANDETQGDLLAIR